MKKSSKPTQQSNPLNPTGNPGQSGPLGQIGQPGNAGDIEPPSARQPIKPIVTAGKSFTVPARSALRKLSTGEPASPFDQLLAEVPDRHLRSFLASVFEEPEVRLVLTTPMPPATRSRSTASAYGRGRSGPLNPRLPAQVLGRAASLASYWGAHGEAVRQVLYVATLIRGIECLLAGFVVGPANLHDVMFTLVLPALRRLDDTDARLASLLRLALDLGNADEVDAVYVPHLLDSVGRALQAVQIGPRPEPQGDWRH